MHSIVSNISPLLQLTCVVGLGIRWFAAPDDRRRTEYVFIALMVATFVDQSTIPFMDRVTLLRPLKDDLFVLRFDDLLGDPGYWVAEIVRRNSTLSWAVVIAYGVVHLAILIAFTTTLYLRPCDLWLLVRAFVTNFVLAVPIYMLIPVCGPAYAIRNFPYVHPTGAPHLIRLLAPCNGVPSVHMSSALLVLWFTRHWRYGRIFGLTFAVATAIATLATGEHYVFDLLCAIPFAAGVYGLAEGSAAKIFLRSGEFRTRKLPGPAAPATD